eukprot:SAG31_NODE_3998_length_3677_cov_10.286193_5_plen_102_part_00
MLELDAKNYHAWSYRQWLVQSYDLWTGELEFTERLLREDLLNNSAWNHRLNAVCHLAKTADKSIPIEVIIREIEFAFVRIEFAIDNDSAWFVLEFVPSLFA